MQSNRSYLKNLILNQIALIFSREAMTRGGIAPELDFAMLMQKAVVLTGNGFDHNIAELSLTSLLALDFFSQEGKLTPSKPYLADVIFSPDIFKYVKGRAYGRCTELQSLVVEVFICQIYQQLILTLQPHIVGITKYSDTYESHLQLNKIKQELRDYLSVVLEFENGPAYSLTLSYKSQLILQHNLHSLGAQKSPIFTAIPLNTYQKMSCLSLEQFLPILNFSNSDLNIINFEQIQLENVSFGGLNYFIPNEYGDVDLPEDFYPLTAKSELVGVIDRVHVYKVNFTNGKQITVSHLPWRQGDLHLSFSEKLYLFNQAKTQEVSTFIHGAYGCELLYKTVISHTELSVLNMEKRYTQTVLGGDLLSINLEFLDNINFHKPVELKINYAFRIWFESLKNEFLENETQLEKKFNLELFERQSLVQNLRIRVNRYDLPLISELKRHAINTLTDLAQSLLVKRQDNESDLVKYDLSWLENFIKGEGSTPRSRFEKESVCAAWQIYRNFTITFVPSLMINVDANIINQELVYQKLLLEKYKHYQCTHLIIPIKKKRHNQSLIKDKSLFYDEISLELEKYPDVLPRFFELKLTFKKHLNQSLINEISESLQPLLQKHNNLKNNVEKFVLRERYKEKIADKVDLVYIMYKRFLRIKNVASEALKFSLVSFVKHRAKEGMFLSSIKRSLPKLIMVHIDCIQQEMEGGFNDLIFCEWLKIAKSAGAIIILLNDNLSNKAQEAKRYFKNKSLIFDFIFECRGIDSNKYMEFLCDLVENHSSNCQRSQRLLIDKRSLGYFKPESVQRYISQHFISEFISLDDNEVNSVSHDDLLALLAYRYNYQKVYEAYFNNIQKSVPLVNPYGFNIRGFKNTLLVCSVSIDNFITKIENFYSHKIKSGIELPLLKPRRDDCFFDKDKSGFIEKLNLLYNSKISSIYAFSKTLGQSFSEATFVLLAIFKDEFLSLSIQESNSILKDIFSKYLKAIIYSKEELNKWMIKEFPRQLLIFRENKCLRIRAMDLKIKQKISDAVYDFIFSAIKHHSAIRSVDYDLAYQNEAYLSLCFKHKIIEFGLLIEEVLASKNIKKKDLRQRLLILKPELERVKLYLSEKIEHDREAAKALYCVLFFYETILLYGSNQNQASFSIRTLVTCFLANNKSMFKLDFSLLSGMTDGAFQSLEQTSYYVFFLKIVSQHLTSSTRLVLDDFCSLIKLSEAGVTAYHAKIQSMSKLRRNIFNYNQQFNNADMICHIDVLDELIVILERTIKNNDSLMVSLLEGWSINWDINFKFKAMSIIHFQLNLMLTTFEKKLLSLGDVNRIWALRSSFCVLHSLMSKFMNLFGIHFFELRMCKLIYSFLNLLFVPSGLTINSGALLGSCDEKILLIGFFKSLYLGCSMNEPLDITTSNIKGMNQEILASNKLCKEEVLPKYFEIFKKDVTECLTFDFDDEVSLEQFMILVFVNINQKLKGDKIFSNSSQISFLLDNLIKLNRLYKDLYGKNVVDPILLSKLHQQVSYLFLINLRNFLCYQSTSEKWNFSWWECRSFVSVLVGDKLRSCSLPSMIRTQYCSIVDFLECSKVPTIKHYSLFRHKIIEESAEIKEVLPKKRKALYTSFFKDLPSSFVLLNSTPKFK